MLIFAANESYGTQLLGKKSGASTIDFLTQKKGRAFLQSLFVQIDFSRKSSEIRHRGSGKSIFLNSEAISAQSTKCIQKPLKSLFWGYMGLGVDSSSFETTVDFENLMVQKMTNFSKPTLDFCAICQ